MLLSPRFPLAALLSITLSVPTLAAVRVTGSTTVNPIVVEAAAILRQEEGLQIVVDTAGGSSGGLAALGDGLADVAMSSRPVTEEDRRRHAGVRFHPVGIGFDAVSMAVSRDVWESGLRSLSADQVRRLYEGSVLRWSELGGPDRRVVFFNKEPGRGTWEVFASWLYGSPAEAPFVNHPEVGSNEEARTKVAATPGAMTQLSVAWVDAERIFALGLSEDGGTAPVRPTSETIAAGSYPLTRTLFLVTDGPPTGAAARLTGFLLTPRGQALVERHGFLPLAFSPGSRVDDTREGR